MQRFLILFVVCVANQLVENIGEAIHSNKSPESTVARHAAALFSDYITLTHSIRRWMKMSVGG